MKANNQEFYVDTVLKKTTTKSALYWDESNPVHIYMFCSMYPNESGATAFCNAKCKWVKWYDENNNVIRHFIPCYRKADGEVGLYDKVGKQFYANAGTGSFLLPSNEYLINQQEYWDGCTIGKTGNGRILKTNRGYQVNSTRIVTIPESGIIFPAAQVPTEGNIPPIDMTSYKTIRVECDTNYKISVIVFEDPSTTTGFKSLGGWRTDPVIYDVESGYRYMTVSLAISNPDNDSISKDKYTHCHILGIK